MTDTNLSTDAGTAGETGAVWWPDLSRPSGPKYLVLAQSLREAIRSGVLAEGAQLPPVRELAWKAGVTPGTVARAYGIVTAEGLLEGTVGRGTFVAARAPQLGPRQSLHVDRESVTSGVVDLRSPQLPEVGQSRGLAETMVRVAERIGSDWLEYPSLRLDRPLREAMVGWVQSRELGEVDAADIALTYGGQNAVNLMLQCCLRGDRPVVYGEELAYPGFRHAVRLNRAEMVAVRLDQHGMRPDALDAMCRRSGGRVVFVTPEAQNPTAVRMPLGRRKEIIAVARMHDLQILEDDCYATGGNEPCLRALAPERVWHVTSLSKTISAGLRMGMLLTPPGRGDAARLAAQHSFFGLARPLTDIVLDLMTVGRAADMRAEVNRIFARRVAIAVETLKDFGPVSQPGVPFLWLPLPLGWRASTFTREAEAEGVLIRSADEYCLVNGHAPNAVRIGIAAGIPEPRFVTAMETLARLLANPPAEMPV